jgi:hypothetical protein
MARNSGSEAGVEDPSSQKAERAGNPDKPRLHEGGAGEPASEGRTKWRGPYGGRDDPGSEKEPGKSRGPLG